MMLVRGDSEEVAVSRISGAVKIAGVYLVVSVVWILFSDRLVAQVPTVADLSWLQTVKGLGFVFVTAVLLYLLARRYIRAALETADALRQAYDETLAGWAAALDIRDRSTGEHTQRVTELAVALAGRFGIEGAELDNVRRGAMLHDIGKMAVPDAVLGKSGPLDPDEWTEIRQHPEMAVRMLDGITYLDGAVVIPWAHHERWDGSGYPQGLRDQAIPFPARLFAVVDVYDALTSERPYRDPMTSAEALDYLTRESGRTFDPAVVTEFVEMMADRGRQGIIAVGGRL